MKILHVVPTYWPAARYGGPIRSVHALARAQAALGHDVEVATTSVDGDRDSVVPHDRPVILDGVVVRYFRSSYLRRLYWSPAMAEFLNRQTPAFDVLHLHSVFLWPTNHAARQAVRAGVPYVLSPRGMLDPELIRRRSRLVKTAWIRMFEAWTVRHAAAVHFTSSREERACHAAGLMPTSSIVLPNGLDDGEPAAMVQTVDATSHRAPYALYLGRVSWKKGIDRLLSAMPHAPELRLVIAGNDDEGLTPALRERAQSLGVAGRVEFAGPVEGSRKWELLAGARCLVLPSRSENFGNVVLEALAVDCPAVITPEVGIADYLGDAAVVADAEPAALGAAMLRLHRDEPLRQHCRATGRLLLNDLFSWERIAERMTQAYGSLCLKERAA